MCLLCSVLFYFEARLRSQKVMLNYPGARILAVCPLAEFTWYWGWNLGFLAHETSTLGHVLLFI